MPYDPETADRLRECLATTPAVTERAMFGGLAFLVGGRMAVAASAAGGLLVRCAPADADDLAARADVGRFVMRGRELTGWLRVDPPAYALDDDLADWVRRGVTAARSA